MADGTTLGADNGIAIAYCMALLEATDIPHPPLEIVLTSDEEAGMTGAMNLDGSLLKGRRMINMDSGSVGVGCFTAGSAAALTAEYEIFVHWETPNPDFESYQLTVKGLTGGHSGGDIDKERGNALHILGVILNQLAGYPDIGDIGFADVSGGMKVNAIPREAQATVVFNSENKETLIKTYEEYSSMLKRFYRVTDPNLEISFQPVKPPERIYDNACLNSLSRLLLLLPCGVQMMSREIDGLVAASCNIGVFETYDDCLNITCMARGASKEHATYIEDKLFTLAGVARADVHFVDRSPAWAYNPDSEIIKLFASYYKEVSGKEPKITAMHGGLECGIFAEKLPGLDIVALGPLMHDLHTPQERLSISSTDEIWKLLCGALGRMK